MSDLRYAIRGMLRNPAFSLLACASLAIGIGANTAIYSVIDAVLLRPLPHVAEPSRLIGIVTDVVSYPLYRDIRDRASIFAAVAGFSYRSVSLSGHGPATLAHAGFVSGTFFGTLGAGVSAGRPLLPSDDTTTAYPAVAVHQSPGSSGVRRQGDGHPARRCRGDVDSAAPCDRGRSHGCAALRIDR